MFRRFSRNIKEGFQGFSRHLGLSISSASAVTITLIIIGVFMVLTYNLQKMTVSVEKSITLSALVDYGRDDEANINRIREELNQIDGITNIQYNTKEDEFNYYIEQESDPDLKQFYEAYRDDNPFSDAFIITIEDGSKLADISKMVNAIDGISEVYDGGTNTYKLVDALETIRIFGGVLVISLVILAVYLVYNTIKVAISSRQDEIWIMRNVGAKNGYIRAPFLVEGVLIGIVGSLIPVIVIIFGYYYLFEQLNGTLFGIFALEAPFPFLYYLCGILLAGGIIVGFIGSYISVCKYLRLRR